jgi:hypothetical protein
MKPVYWLIGGLIVALLLLGGGAYGGYQYATKKARAEQADAVTAYVDALADMQKRLDEERRNIKGKYREKIEYIHTAADPTGCLDTRVPDDILQQLRAE